MRKRRFYSGREWKQIEKNCAKEGCDSIDHIDVCVSVTNSIVSNRQIDRGYRRPNQYGPRKNRPQCILIRFNHINTRHRQKDPGRFVFGAYFIFFLFVFMGSRYNSGVLQQQCESFFRPSHHKIQQSMHIASAVCSNGHFNTTENRFSNRLIPFETSTFEWYAVNVCQLMNDCR